MNDNSTFLNTTVTNPFAGLPEVVGTTLANATIARSQLLRPFPGFLDILGSNNDGKSWYHSGQFSLQKRFSKGYTIQTSYTWSKWLQATEYLNGGDAKPTRMIADQDAPHRLAFSGMYEFPLGKGKQFLSKPNWLTNAVVGGWQVGATVQLQSGFPIAFGQYNITTAVTSGDIFYKGGDPSIPSSQRNTSKWFNTSAFISVLNDTSTNASPVNHLRTLPFRFANVRRDYIKNVDFTMKKDIMLRETMKIQLRFELLNAFNEPYFPAPVTSQTSTSFGQISASNQDNYARRAQVGLKFIF